MQVNKTSAPAIAAAPVQTLWTVVGAAWKKLDKKGREMITVKIGNTREGINSITINNSDVLFLRASAKRPNMPKDPDYQLCVNA
jgi:hypothetical protein